MSEAQSKPVPWAEVGRNCALLSPVILVVWFEGYKYFVRTEYEIMIALLLSFALAGSLLAIMLLAFRTGFIRFSRKQSDKDGPSPKRNGE